MKPAASQVRDLLTTKAVEKEGILLVSFGVFEKSFLRHMAGDVEELFRLPVAHEANHFDLTDYYDPGRRQYDGNALLKMLDAMYDKGKHKTIGLFRVDLFIPILTYIFGQATLNGGTAIASLYRLRSEQYGMERNDELLYDRFLKVVVHELGHAFGLIHCRKPACVMRPATCVEDLDQKDSRFCAACGEEVIWATGSWE